MAKIRVPKDYMRSVSNGNITLNCTQTIPENAIVVVYTCLFLVYNKTWDLKPIEETLLRAKILQQISKQTIAAQLKLSIQLSIS